VEALQKTPFVNSTAGQSKHSYQTAYVIIILMNKKKATIIFLLPIALLLAIFIPAYLINVKENNEIKPAAACFKGNEWSSINSVKVPSRIGNIDGGQPSGGYGGVYNSPDTEGVARNLASCLRKNGYTIRDVHQSDKIWEISGTSKSSIIRASTRRFIQEHTLTSLDFTFSP